MKVGGLFLLTAGNPSPVLQGLKSFAGTVDLVPEHKLHHSMESKKTSDRNRKIFEAHQSGKDIAEISMSSGLSIFTIRSILQQEAHRRAVSREPYYVELRDRSG